MILKEIIEKFKQLPISEERQIIDEYGELVFFNKEIEELNRIFSDILGPAIKPPGLKPTENDLQLTKDYGGIRSNQTLFKKEFSDAVVIAMFWPWQDDIHTTLKLILLRK